MLEPSVTAVELFDKNKMEDQVDNDVVIAENKPEEQSANYNKLRFQYDDYDVTDDTHLAENAGFGKNRLRELE